MLPLDVYTRLLDDLSSVGIKAPFDEFTFEVNPEDIVEKGESYVESLLKLGVNRISMGLQSFDDAILKWMNRRHDSATAVKAYHILENAGVENISIDLIFGLPQLTEDMWEETLKRALDISSKSLLPKHISSYQLSVEPGSALAKLLEREVWAEASDEQCSKQYDMLCDTLSKAGYHHYEISNFAQEGYEAKHNSAYWEHIPYVGLGPGAHSFSSHSRQWNNPDLQAYISDPLSVQEHEDLDAEQLVIEKIMLALRTSAGISEAYLREYADKDALEMALKCADLVPAGSGKLRIPENRFFVSDNIISKLI